MLTQEEEAARKQADHVPCGPLEVCEKVAQLLASRRIIPQRFAFCSDSQSE